VEVNDGV
jgi:hypothetical protein